MMGIKKIANQANQWWILREYPRVATRPGLLFGYVVAGQPGGCDRASCAIAIAHSEMGATADVVDSL